MPRGNKKGRKPLREANSPSYVLEPTERITPTSDSPSEKPGCDLIEPIIGMKSLLNDENCQPGTSSIADDLSHDTAALYNELDSFRQRWRREIEETKQPNSKPSNDEVDVQPGNSKDNPKLSKLPCNPDKLPYQINPAGSSDKYNEAKRLFLIAAGMEQDDMHLESIRFYRQAMHLCPDIERLIFREQCEASLQATKKDDSPKLIHQLDKAKENKDLINSSELLDRVLDNYNMDLKDNQYIHCRPAAKQKSESLHISDLPHELILQIFLYIIGADIDLASLESVGLVCRGFFLLSRDPILWRSICFSTWDSDTLKFNEQYRKKNSCNSPSFKELEIDWRLMFLKRPRVNYDGVYISRTRYFRQGDVGFQDLTYRPFHVIRYYRYIRFFPDRRVLVLVTNEEPDKIIPIFRHAIRKKHFSPDLSVLEGTFEYVSPNQINISAEKDCRPARNSIINQRRHAQMAWTRQTPINQKFSLKFELKTAENKPYTNNVLKWLEYTILSRMDTGQEMTSFDLTSDAFPNLIFARVRRLSLKLTEPLPSH